ncbi:MAG TPA: DUF4105 domain-containing protein [Flavitalea sp.]|nr:DUF4105 domain-containing protein [Flavitalea sp.]
MLIAFFLISICGSAQRDTCTLRISLLTCSPGEELYSIFGHSALRVKDTSTNTDIIFNYGTFDFSDPDFYPKFLQGRLQYFLSVEGFSDFTYGYELEKRGIVEQVLHLSCINNRRLFDALIRNTEDANKFYAYDFFFDNCSTRLRDMVAKNSGDSVQFWNIYSGELPSYRQEIHKYLDRSGQYWSKLGMDLLLGARVDKKVTNHSSMFLPDNLYKGFDSATVQGHPLIGSRAVVLPEQTVRQQPFLITPLLVFSTFLIAGIILGFTRRKKSQKPVVIFDFVLFFLTGCAGWVMLLMWVATEHKACGNNMNLFWAWPTHLIMCFFINRSSQIGKYYFGLAGITAIIVLAGWHWWPQDLNNNMIPLVILLAYRSLRNYLKH